MNRVFFIFSFCISFSLAAMEQIQQLQLMMRNCDVSGVKTALTNQQLEQHTDTLVDTALRTNCRQPLLELLDSVWQRHHAPHDTLGHGYGKKKRSSTAVPPFCEELAKHGNMLQWYLSLRNVS